MGPDQLGVMVPIVAIAGAFLVSIVKTMVRHQQKMAELYHRNAQAVDPRIETLQRDMAELKDLVHQQTIALDRLATPLPSSEIRERVGG